MSIEENLIFARNRLKLTQKQVGDRLGITAQAVSQWETGESQPEIERLPEIAKELRVSVEWLLTGQDWSDPNDPRPVWARLSIDQRSMFLRMMKAAIEIE